MGKLDFISEFSQSVSSSSEVLSSGGGRRRKLSDTTIAEDGIVVRISTSCARKQQIRPHQAPSIMSIVQISFLIITSTLLLLDNGKQFGFCAKLPDIYWNSSNPIFRIDNTDHIFDVNKKQNDHDQIDLICPQSQPQPQLQLQLQAADAKLLANATQASLIEQERYIIYSVSKEEYDTCRLNGPNSARVVAVCDQPPSNKAAGQLKPLAPFTVTFRSFTPQPNGLEFKAGQDYYFISALNNVQDPVKRFSPCRELNMKVIFKVCCKSQAQHQQQPTASAVTSASVPNAPLDSRQSRVQLLQTNLAAASMTSNKQQPSRRPQAAAQPAPVITLKPSLIASGGSNSMKPMTMTNTLHDYLSQIGSPSFQQPQQPITVLPIEVLSAPSGGEQPAASTQSKDSDQEEKDKNDIVLDEQPSTPSPPVQPPYQRRPPSSSPFESAPMRVGQPHMFALFDPTAPPEVIRSYERWTPTPLPADLRLKPQPRVFIQPAPSHQQPPMHQIQQQQLSQSQHHQPSTFEQNIASPWQQLRQQPSYQQYQQQQAQQPVHRPLGPGRLNFYPQQTWSTYSPGISSSASRDLITVLDSQTSAASRSHPATVNQIQLWTSLLASLILLLSMLFNSNTRVHG